MAEARQHNYMLIGDIIDNYINNIIKLYMGLVWASKFGTKYIIENRRRCLCVHTTGAGISCQCHVSSTTLWWCTGVLPG